MKLASGTFALSLSLSLRKTFAIMISLSLSPPLNKRGDRKGKKLTQVDGGERKKGRGRDAWMIEHGRKEGRKERREKKNVCGVRWKIFPGFFRKAVPRQTLAVSGDSRI